MYRQPIPFADRHFMDETTQPHIDELLFEALRAIYRFERQKVRHFGVNYEEIYLLQFLRRNGPLRMSDIAAEMTKPISTATRLMDRLVARGLVVRKKDSADGRSVRIAISPDGMTLVREVEAHTFEIVSANLHGMPGPDIEAFMKTAARLKDIFSMNPEQEKSV